VDPLRLQNGDGVLLIRLGAVGDIVRTLPCLARLRDSEPDIRLAWVVEPPAAPLLPGRPWLDEVFVFPRQIFHPSEVLSSPGATARTLRDFVHRVRAFRPRLSLDFQGTAKSALIGRAGGAPQRLGFDRTGSREGSFIFNNIWIRPSSPHLNRTHKNLELLRPLRLQEGPIKFPFRGGGPSARVHEFLDSLGDRVRIAVHAGTSARQSHKQWPSENFAKLITEIERREWIPILTWGPGERALIDNIQDQSRGAGFPTPALDLEEMRQVIAQCRLFVGADTGPMHLAWSQGVPVVALFGSTDPRINGPLGPGHRILAPSWDGRRPPPPRGDRSAIRQIRPEHVFQEILSVLSPLRTAGGGVLLP
jgi:lipopolysaccharide heptosyltransferase I